MAKKQAKRKPSEFCEPMVDISEAIEEAMDLVEGLTDHKLRLRAKYAQEELPFLVIQFGRETVMDAIRQGFVGYKGNMALTLEKLGGICAHIKDPAMQTDQWILSRFASYFPDDFDRMEAKELLRSARCLRGEDGIAEIEEMSKDPDGTNWWEQTEMIKAAILKGAKDDEG